MTAHLPNYPIRSLDKSVGSIINLGRFVKHLPDFGNSPFGRYLSAVVFKPFFSPCRRYLVDFCSVLLRGVVLPKLYIGVRFMDKLGHKTKRSTVLFARENGAGGKINAYTSDIIRRNTRFFYNLRNYRIKHIEIIPRVLQSPVHTELFAGRESFRHNAVGIIK